MIALVCALALCGYAFALAVASIVLTVRRIRREQGPRS